MLERLFITDTKATPAFSRYLDQQRRLRAANKPSLANGFEIPGLHGVGVRPYRDEHPFGGPLARWTLVNFEW